MNKLNLMFECESCKQKFPVSQDKTPNSLTHKKEYKSNGQSIFLTYYDCPSCGRRHYVQIDDTSSLQELTRITTEFRALMVKRQKGKTISKKQSDKFKKARQHLSVYRTNLMKQFTGALVHDNETDSDFELRFSIV